jgi:acetone carboxylase gamma subunit
VLHPVIDTIEAVTIDGRRALRCSLCHHAFGGYDEDYKRSALVRELPLTDSSPMNRRCLLDRFVLREFVCPGCGTAVAVDVQLQDAPIRDECRLGGGG